MKLEGLYFNHYTNPREENYNSQVQIFDNQQIGKYKYT